MTKLLRFRDRILLEVVFDQVFGESVLNVRRSYKIASGDLQIAVILQHSCKDHLGVSYSIELIEVLFFKRPTELDGTIASEVEEDHAVIVFDGADGLSVFSDDKSREVLVDDA